MDGMFEVTVKVWRNTPSFELWQDGGGVGVKPAGFEPGHAALKLQAIGAGKGDYLWLSFWPNNAPMWGQAARQSHTMPKRYGNGSYAAHSALPAPDRLRTKLTTAIPTNDKTLEGVSAGKSFYFTGPNFAQMEAFIRALASPHSRWHLHNRNCAAAVFECLLAGGAPNPPFANADLYTPNRVAQWCETLAAHYGGMSVG